MIIKSNLKKYNVYIKNDFLFFQKLENLEFNYFVIDKKVYELYKNSFFKNINTSRLYLIDAKEKNKTIKEALRICEKITCLSSKRNTTLISIGGGIAQDVTGFVASILYRGIKWIFLPTTLLSSADSCIGSKTSLNWKHYKNLLGTFFPPDNIYIYPKFFETLSNKDYRSGLGELLKFNFMSNSENVNSIDKDINKLLQRDNNTIKEYLIKSLKYKKLFIEKDEFDRSERVFLNFAHTYGHAFESISNYRIPHGTAVAMGLICANNVSVQRGYLEKDIVDKMDLIIKKIIKVSINKIDLSIESILKNFKKDKKQINDNLTLVLLEKKSIIKVHHNIEIYEIEKSVKHLLEILK